MNANFRFTPRLSLTLLLLVIMVALQSRPSRSDKALHFTEQLVSDDFGYCFSVDAADLDKDGDLDLVSADALRNHVYWFDNDGKGNFTRRTIHNNENGWFERCAIGDIDGDTHLDIMIVKNLTGELVWFRNNGTPRDNRPWQRFVVTTDIKRAYDVALWDVDGDRDLDAVASAWVGNYFAWFTNPARDQFDKEWPRHVINADLVGETRTVRAGDFNGDGRLDLLGTARAGNLLAWYDHGGQPVGFWKQHVIDNQSPSPTHGHPIDLDADGDLDVVMAFGMLATEGAQETHQVAWYENLGRGEKWIKHAVGSLPFGFEVVAADLDGDMDLDLVSSAIGEIPYVAGTSIPGQVVWFENQRTPQQKDKQQAGKWRKHILKNPWPSGTQIIVADLNNDGRPDIAAAGEKGSHEIRWWRNDGIGNMPVVAPPTGKQHSRTAAFSVGYGFSGRWSTAETIGANTPAVEGSSFTVGDIQFTIEVGGRNFSSAGPVFKNRVLANGDGAAATADSAYTTVKIKAEYVGTLPAAIVADSGAMRLRIERLAVHAAKHQAVGTNKELWWLETTPDYGSTSNPTILKETQDMSSAGDYLQLTWNPEDIVIRHNTGITRPGITRTFALPMDRHFALDGLEISGSAEFLYATPEPSH